MVFSHQCLWCHRREVVQLSAKILLSIHELSENVDTFRSLAASPMCLAAAVAAAAIARH